MHQYSIDSRLQDGWNRVVEFILTENETQLIRWEDGLVYTATLCNENSHVGYGSHQGISYLLEIVYCWIFDSQKTRNDHVLIIMQ